MSNKAFILQFSLVALLSIVYVGLRYLYFGDVSLSHVPAYLFNKAVCLALMLAWLLSSVSFIRSKRELAVRWAKCSVHLLFLHVLLSLALLNSKNYVAFYQYGETSLKGELLISFGVLATYLFWRLHSRGFNRYKSIISLLAVVFVSVHLLVLGIGSWLSYTHWLINLPSISFISFLIALLLIPLHLFSDTQSK